MSQDTLEQFSIREEIAHSITHGVGALLSVAALVVMIVRSVVAGVELSLLAAIVFGVSLIVLYTASTLYHAFPWPRLKRTFQTFDHIAIYLLIAGTYTPFSLLTLGGAQGWTVFGLIWGLAMGGAAFELISKGRWPKIALGIYLAMGWIAIFYTRDLMAALPLQGLVLLLAGGLSYTVGAVFYAWRGLPYNHTTWHLFVLGGSAAHFFCIMEYVLTGRA